MVSGSDAGALGVWVYAWKPQSISAFGCRRMAARRVRVFHRSTWSQRACKAQQTGIRDSPSCFVTGAKTKRGLGKGRRPVRFPLAEGTALGWP